MNNSRLLDKYLQKEETSSKISKWFTKILLCIIFLLSSLIFTSLNDDYLVLYKKYVFDETLDFAKFKNFYSKISNEKEGGTKDKMVFGNTLEYTDIKKYNAGQSLTIGKDVPINAIGGGIVVFAGEKPGFNNTVIIQGSDGYDIWYGNLDNVDVKIYDYIDSGSIIASASDNLYLVISKDSKNYTYEEYQNQI